jgi:D-glycero-D-manno-heptose 1,7-bisphosphate phosphatase
MKLVILGRDGVINATPATFIDAPEHWAPLPGALEAIARLHREGWRIVIVTHQPAVAHGALHMETLNRIHARMLDLIRHKGGDVEAVFVCPHGPESRCRCRPPQPGLFEEIAERLKLNLAGASVVVASEAEATAARTAGARPLRLNAAPAAPSDAVVWNSLNAYVDDLLTGRIGA